MNRIVFLLILFPFLVPVKGQLHAEFTPMPRAMEAPSWNADEMDWSDRGSDPWWVYADRDSVKLYTDESCSTVKGNVNYLEAFLVWEESADAIHAVSPARPGEGLVAGTVFTENAIDRGWIRKEHLVLWQKALMKEKVLLKALVTKELHSNLADTSKPTRKVEVPENEFRIYNVIKMDHSTLLLMGTDVLHTSLRREDVFWVNTRDVNILDNRSAYAPKWDEIDEENKLSVYGTKSEAGNGREDAAMISVSEPNPYLGFLARPSSSESSLEALLPQEKMKKVYLEKADPKVQKAYLLDLNQFLQLQALIQLICDYEVDNPVELEVELRKFFNEYGMKDEDIGAQNVAQLLSSSIGFELDLSEEYKATQVGKISNAKRRALRIDFSKTLEMLNSPDALNNCSFFSEIEYFWIPESWMIPASLQKLSLGGGAYSERIPEPYKDFEVFYIDGSAIETMDGNTYKKLRKVLHTSIMKASREAESNENIGIYAYYSNGLNTIKNDNTVAMDITIEKILTQLSNGSFFPDKHRDKSIIENELYLHYLEKVEESLVMHFYIPQNFLSEDLWERGQMLVGLPERMYSLTMPKKEAHLEIQLHIYAISDEERLQEDITFINDYYSDSEHVTVNFAKY